MSSLMTSIGSGAPPLNSLKFQKLITRSLEWYLDTLALLEQFRQQPIGKMRFLAGGCDVSCLVSDILGGLDAFWR